MPYSKVIEEGKKARNFSVGDLIKNKKHGFIGILTEFHVIIVIGGPNEFYPGNVIEALRNTSFLGSDEYELFEGTIILGNERSKVYDSY